MGDSVSTKSDDGENMNSKVDKESDDDNAFMPSSFSSESCSQHGSQGHINNCEI